MPSFYTNNLVFVADDKNMCNVLRHFAENLAAHSEATGFDLSDIARETKAESLYRKVGPLIERWYTVAFVGVPLEGDDCDTLVHPDARGVSDSATVQFRQYNKNLVLSMHYSTAYFSNEDDLDQFFKGLPTGTYGIAYYGSSEASDYEMVETFSGTHRGRAELYKVEDCHCEDTVYSDELRKLRDRLSTKDWSSISDEKELARVVAICEWTEFEDD